MQKRFFVLGAILSAAFVTGFGCGDSSSGDGNSGLPTRNTPKSDGGSSGGDLDATSSAASCTDMTIKVSDTPACDTCAKQKCCDYIQACEKSSDCKQLQACLEPCANDDITCILTCQTAHDHGAAALQDVASCAQTECKAECPDQTPDADPFGDAF